MTSEVQLRPPPSYLKLVASDDPSDAPCIIERLRNCADRGMDTPEALSLHEIQQLSYALSLYLSIKEQE